MKESRVYLGGTIVYALGEQNISTLDICCSKNSGLSPSLIESLVKYASHSYFLKGSERGRGRDQEPKELA